jgi:hypothetical protein
MNPDTFEMKFSAGDVFFHQAAWPALFWRHHPALIIVAMQVPGYQEPDYRLHSLVQRDTSVIVDFDASENRLEPKPPSIELFK